MEYLLFLQNIRENMSPIFNAFINEISNFAINNGSAILMMIVMYVFDKRLGRRICGSYGLNVLISVWIKNIACIKRPWLRDSRIIPAEGMKETAQGFSFPSGHTAFAGSLFFPLIVFAKNNIIKIISIFLIMLIGFSRNYVGVHTFSDVFFGFIFSVIGCEVVFKIMDFIEKDEFDEKGHTKDKINNSDIIAFIISIIIFIISILYVKYKSYPPNATEAEILEAKTQMIVVGVIIIGYFIGLILERRFVKFNVDAPLFLKIIRVVVGLLILIFTSKFLSSFIKNYFGELAATIVNYIFVLMDVTFFTPLIFTFYEKKLKLFK